MSDDDVFASSIGIDLGTTQCCVAVYNSQEQRPTVIHNFHGEHTTPSLVAFLKNDENEEEILVGSEVLACDASPENIIYEVKRLIGRRFNEKSVESDKTILPYKVINENEKPVIKIFDHTYSPEEISAKLLLEQKKIAEAFTGRKIEGAVVTVPAHFNNAQRQSTKLAAQQAGFKDIRLLNEPTAAVVQHSRYLQESKTVLVYDFGGGTFDVTLAQADRNEVSILAKEGDAHLGGADLDNVLIKYVAEKFRIEHGIDIMRGRAIRRLKKACKKAKETLSFRPSAVVQVEAVSDGIDLHESITRQQFENLCSNFFNLTIDCVRRTLTNAGIQAENVDEVLIVGGSSRIPKVVQLLDDEFGKEKLVRSQHPEHAIALGAAIQAAKWIDLDPNLEKLSVTDVVPLSIGTQEFGGLFVPMIPRGTVYPFRHSDDIVTSTDGQKSVLIEIYEGERRKAEFNNLLGRVELDGLPSAPAGKQSVHVCFEIDSNGILTVSASNDFVGDVVTTITTDMLTYSQTEVNNFIETARNNERKDQEFVRWHIARVEHSELGLELREEIEDDRNEMTSDEYSQKMRLIEDYLTWVNSLPNVDPGEFGRLLGQLFEDLANIGDPIRHGPRPRSPSDSDTNFSTSPSTLTVDSQDPNPDPNEVTPISRHSSTYHIPVAPEKFVVPIDIPPPDDIKKPKKSCPCSIL